MRSRTHLPTLLSCTLALALPASVSAATTPARPQPPLVVTSTGVSNVTYSSAILYGWVDPRGAPTVYAFQYGVTTAYSAQTPLAPAGNGTISVKLTDTITGLQPGTTYHYRITATNSSGRTVG